MRKLLLLLLGMIIVLSSLVYAIDTNDCIGYWSLDNADESGVTYDDLSTKSHDATETEEIAHIPGKIAEGRNFTGTNTNYVTMGDVNDYEASSTFSVTAWVNLSQIIPVASGGQYFISKQKDTDNWHGWVLVFIDYQSDSDNDVQYSCDTATGGNPNLYASDLKIPLNNWFFIALVVNSTHSCVSVNASSLSCTAAVCDYENVASNFAISGRNGGGYGDYSEDMDEISVWNKTLTSSEISELYSSGVGYNPFSGDTPPNITSYYVLSAEQNYSAWNTNKSFPVPTYDTTPTVDIVTNKDAYCRISSSEGIGNKNYTGMSNNTRNCSDNTATNHTCTLYPTDELITSTEYLYISCKGITGLETYNSTSGALKLEILGLEENSTKALDNGIDTSEIGAVATIYNDKQVYLANTTTQATGTVDRVVSYGNYRWMFNLYEDTAVGLFNMTPRVYVMEIQLETLSFTEIKNRVSKYINDTYP